MHTNWWWITYSILYNKKVIINIPGHVITQLACNNILKTHLILCYCKHFSYILFMIFECISTDHYNLEMKLKINNSIVFLQFIGIFHIAHDIKFIFHVTELSIDWDIKWIARPSNPIDASCSEYLDAKCFNRKIKHHTCMNKIF